MFIVNLNCWYVFLLCFDFVVSVVFLCWFIVCCFCVSLFAGVKVQPENKRQVW